MNKIQETIERGVEEFKTFVKYGDDTNTSVERSKLKAMFKAHQTALLEAMLEEVRGKKTNFEETTMYPHVTEHASVHEAFNVACEAERTRNQALQDIETIINKAIEN